MEIKRVRVGRVRRRAGIGALFSVFALLLSGCGVESYPYLEPPAGGTVKEPLYGVEYIFQFGNTPENNMNYFQGFEVYYKFYGSDRDSTALSEDQNAINNTQTKEKLESLEYRRLYSVNEVTAEPLISISGDNKNEDFYIYLDFSLMGGTDKPYPLVEYLSTSFPFARYIKVDNSDEQKIVGFLPSDFSLSKSYSDFSEDVVSEDTKLFSIVLYVMTYGKYDVIYDLYSKPVYLGRIQLTASE